MVNFSENYEVPYPVVYVILADIKHVYNIHTNIPPLHTNIIRNLLNFHIFFVLKCWNTIYCAGSIRLSPLTRSTVAASAIEIFLFPDTDITAQLTYEPIGGINMNWRTALVGAQHTQKKGDLVSLVTSWVSSNNLSQFQPLRGALTLRGQQSNLT